MAVIISISESEGYLLSVGKVSPNDQRDFLLIEFLESNLKGIGLAFKIDQNRGIHTIITPLDHRTVNLKRRVPQT